MKISLGDLAYAFTFFGFPGVNGVVETGAGVEVPMEAERKINRFHEQRCVKTIQESSINERMNERTSE